MRVEHVAEPARAQKAEERRPGAPQLQAPTLGAQVLAGGRRDGDAGGVDEVQVFQIDDQPVMPGAGQLAEAGPQRARGVEVELGGQVQHGPFTLGAGQHGKLHAALPVM